MHKYLILALALSLPAAAQSVKSGEVYPFVWDANIQDWSALRGSSSTGLVVAAAGQSVPATTGSVSTTGTVATLAIYGADWATARVTVSGSTTSSLYWQVSSDGGTNYSTSSAPYSQRVDLVAAYPSVTSTLVGAGTWEMPLPGNATNVRVVVLATGSSVTATVSPGRPYVPGVPTKATMFSGVGSSSSTYTTGVLDLSGFSRMLFAAQASGVPPLGWISAGWVGDTGSYVQQNWIYDNNSSSAFIAAAGLGTSFYNLGAPGGGGVLQVGVSMMPKRVQFLAVPVSGSTVTMLLEVER